MTAGLVVISEDDPHLNTEVAAERVSRVDARESQVYGTETRSCLSSVLCLSRNLATFSATSAVRGRQASRRSGWHTFIREFVLGEVLS